MGYAELGEEERSPCDAGVDCSSSTWPVDGATDERDTGGEPGAVKDPIADAGPPESGRTPGAEENGSDPASGTGDGPGSTAPADPGYSDFSSLSGSCSAASSGRPDGSPAPWLLVLILGLSRPRRN